MRLILAKDCLLEQVVKKKCSLIPDDSGYWTVSNTQYKISHLLVSEYNSRRKADTSYEAREVCCQIVDEVPRMAAACTV